MGTWGPALFSDDLAADLRDDFRELVGEGFTATSAVDELLVRYASTATDVDERSVFWLVLADTQWRLGRLDERTLHNALEQIDNGEDLARWTDPKLRAKRAAVLARLRTQLLSPAPAPKRVRRLVKAANDWALGEVVAFHLLSGRSTLFRVIGHHEDRGGRLAVCELLDWVGDVLPTAEEIQHLAVRRSKTTRRTAQFILGEPRTAKDRARIVRPGIASRPWQKNAYPIVFPWQFIDRCLRELFELA